MKRTLTALALLSAIALTPRPGQPADGIEQVNLAPTEDTYSTHNDKTIYGFDPVIKVGIEPQECFTGGWNPCKDDDLECCDDGPEYNYCAAPGQCAGTPPKYETFRKWYGYVRFDVSNLPEGKIQSASLRLQQMDKVEAMGGPVKAVVTQLKGIGMPNTTCEWQEETLNDTNGTTWNSLPQNLSMTPEGVWAFDVTKAVQNWVEGNVDVPGTPIQPNCGFYLYDPDYGNVNAPIQRWVLFSSKEGGLPPQLSITIAQDLDGDGYFGDCNEEDAAIHPGAVEICDWVDNDCDGTEDEEDCDGLDNDCDGQIDEEPDLCGPGMVCLYNQCIVTCKNECSGPYDLTCFKNADGVWEEWACKNVDDDPCLEYYKWETCKPEYNCDIGSCSSNCIDLCDPEQVGTTFCYQDNLDNWNLAQCDDFDGDGCLEPGDLEPCGAAAFCHAGVCWPDCMQKCDTLASGGCLDVCVPGEARCVKADDGLFHLQQCEKSVQTLCLEWVDKGGCTDPLLPFCTPQTGEVAGPQDFCVKKLDCEDENFFLEPFLGVYICYKDSVDNWHVGLGGDADGDGCYDFDPVEDCEPAGGCMDATCSPGCSARCDDFLALQCSAGGAVEGCYDIDSNGCLEWNLMQQCDPVAQKCEDAKCVDIAPPCQHECDVAGAVACKVTDDMAAFLFTCAVGGDPDPCREWVIGPECPYGCDATDPAACAAAPPVETSPEATEDVVAEVVADAPVADILPDVKTDWLDEPLPDVPGKDEQMPPVDIATQPDPQADATSLDAPGADTGEGESESDSGCSCRTSAERGAQGLPHTLPGMLLLVVLACAAFLAARYRMKSQPRTASSWGTPDQLM